MKFRFTPEFNNLLLQMPEDIKKKAKKQLEMLLENPRHPSLRMHKMKLEGEIWEISITMSYRITFTIEGDLYILRKIGTHDVLKNP